MAFAQQNRLGVAGEVLRVGGVANLGAAVDLAGFPNGRRPKDDVVDIALVAMLGGLCVINGTNNGLGLNGVPGIPSLTSVCAPSSVPLGATSAAVHDGVDQVCWGTRGCRQRGDGARRSVGHHVKRCRRGEGRVLGDQRQLAVLARGRV